MLRLGRIAALLAVFSALAIPARVRAAPGDKPLAEALFQDGRDLLDQNRIEEACAKFAASEKIEPKIGTLLNLAACHERQGRTATAWAEFVEAESVAERTNQSDRVSFAKEHAEALEKQLSRVVIRTSAPATLTLDGLVLDGSVAGTAIPLDPGEHTLAVSEARKHTWTTTFSVPAGPSEQRVDAPPLSDELVAAAAQTEPLPPRPARRLTPGRELAGYSALALGAVGIGVGTYFGLHAFSLRSDAERECTGSACSSRGLDSWNDVGKSADASTVAFALGAAALAVGAYLLLFPPASSPSEPVRR